MKQTLFSFTEISPDLFVYHGAVNTGILRWGSRAVLIDCDDTLTPARLAELGIDTVECIYCTQHRRPNTAGILSFQAGVFAPHGERSQFEGADAYWKDWHNRWHLYHCRPGPLAPLQDIPLRGVVGEGDEFQWGNFRVRALDTPGMTDGAVSYLIQSFPPHPAKNGVIFSGDVLYGSGRVWDLHSLQKGVGTPSDYHGFLGAAKTLISSLKKLAGTGAGWFVPSHGELIPETAAAALLTVRRLEQLFRNYASISALNFYFPLLFEEFRDDPWRMPPAAVHDFPDFIRPVAATSFAVLSESGALFLIDCGSDAVLDTLNTWREQGVYTQLEGCWVTHYHDDHVDALHHLAAFFRTPIFAEAHIAEIITHPNRFYLPCISPAAAAVDHLTSHGETWQWHEFELTSLHFPGQSFYHGGLLLRGHGETILFCGDSLAPTGLDDYTAGNRNFLGPGRGYRRCIDLLRQYHPDLILNQHQQQGFHFTDERLAYMEQMLIAREQMLAELLPWEHPNYGTDEGWIRAYPYEIDAHAGGTCIIEVRASQHASQPISLTATPVLPPGWSGEVQSLPDIQAGVAWDDSTSRTGAVIHIPEATEPGSFLLPFRVTWAGRYLGQICHAIIQVI